MKTVKIKYCCDYCKQPINTDDDAVCVLLPGRIGYQDSLIMDPEYEAQHYHDYCMNYLLCLTASNNPAKQDPEPEVIAEPDPEETHVKNLKQAGIPVIDTSEGKKREEGKKDLPALQAFLDAGRTGKWCADEFRVAPSTITHWKEEIKQMKKEGTWDAYCEERRAK